MVDRYYFAAVEFVDDPNVVGLTYWYLCDFEEVAVGDVVTAPLGRELCAKPCMPRNLMLLFRSIL